MRELPQAEVAAETMGTDPDTGKENASRLCPEVTNLPATRFYHAALSAGGNSGFNTVGSLAVTFSADVGVAFFASLLQRSNKGALLVLLSQKMLKFPGGLC